MTGMEIFRDWKQKLEKLGLEETHISKIATAFGYHRKFNADNFKNILNALLESSCSWVDF